MLRHPCHATRVWNAILAMDLPLYEPLDIAPVYWQQFVLHQGIAPSVANLCMENHTLFQMGLEGPAVAHGAIGMAGTLAIWLDLLPCLLTALDTH